MEFLPDKGNRKWNTLLHLSAKNSIRLYTFFACDKTNFSVVIERISKDWPIIVRQNCKNFTHSMQFDEIFGENDRSGQYKFCMNCKMVCQNDKYALLLKIIIIVKKAE